MSDDGNRDQIGRMDLNMYLGLSSPRPGPDICSDLALVNRPLSPAMSSSQNQSFRPIAQSTQPSQDPEHCSYVPPVSPSYEQTLDHDIVDVPFVSDRPSAQDSTDAMIPLEGYSNNYVYDPFDTLPNLSITTPAPSFGSQVPYENTLIPHMPPSPTYCPFTPTNSLSGLQAQDENSQISYSPVNPTYSPSTPMNPPTSPTAQIHENNGGRRPIRSATPFRTYEEVWDISLQGEFFGPHEEFWEEFWDDSLQQGYFRYSSERLIELNRRPRSIQFPPIPSSFSSNTTRAFHNTRGPNENSVTQKTGANGIAAEDIEEKEGMKDQSNGAGNFDCNVCLIVAKEPVVTSCGHLFCWPCLYQWLYCHSDHKECPVCKGEVTESNVTPIYGRGSSAEEVGDEGVLGFNIPPRPRGHRLDSSRQQRIPSPPSQWPRFIPGLRPPAWLIPGITPRSPTSRFRPRSRRRRLSPSNEF